MTSADKLLLIDIETASLVKSYSELPEKLQELWQHKSSLLVPDSDDYQTTYKDLAGIYAEYGKIICIGLAYFTKQDTGYKLKVKMIADHDEKKLLEEFTSLCNIFFQLPDRQFCGHNIREFDIPYICRRCYINQIPLPSILKDLQQKKPWENPILDTLQFWKFGEYKNFVSVDLLAAVLDIESPKSDIKGSDVSRVYWHENDLERIVAYCSRDVITVAQIYLRLNGLPLLTPSQIEHIQTS